MLQVGKGLYYILKAREIYLLNARSMDQQCMIPLTLFSITSAI